MSSRAPTLSVLALAVILVVTGARASDAHTVVYVSNADSRDICVLDLNERDGSSRVVERMAVAGSVWPLAVSPDHKYLYASLRSDPFSVSSFAIDRSSGRLTLVKTVPLADNMAYLSTDRTGHYLLGASYSGNKISVNALGPRGEVGPTPLEVIPTGQNAHAAATDPSNRFLFVTNLGDDVILQFRFNGTTGAITPNSPSAVKTQRGAGPRHFVFHPNCRFLFCTNELDGTVSTYRLGASGTLTLIGSVSAVPAGFTGDAPAAADLHLTPNGKFLYASERTSSTIAAFRVNGDSGALTPLGSYPTETQPRGFDIDPEGKYLLAAGQKSGGLSTYKIDPDTGALRLLSHRDVGKNPNWVQAVALPG